MSIASPTVSRRDGFTIVELLIVIVVIGILAAITIVAYNGIQSRASDASVQSDLNAISKRMELYRIDDPSGLYPWGVNYNALKLPIAKSAYAIDGTYNLLNCTTYTGGQYAVLARSKSGKKFWISSTFGGVKEEAGSTNFSIASGCPTMLAGSTADGTVWGGSGPGGWNW